MTLPMCISLAWRWQPMALLTDRDEEGFLPEMLKTLYDERIKFKKMQKAEEKKLQDERDPTVRAQLVKNIAAYENQQKVRKVNLNSAYGALGSNYFRFFDVDIAEAVTVTGQVVIRWVANDINRLPQSAVQDQQRLHHRVGYRLGLRQRGQGRDIIEMTTTKAGDVTAPLEAEDGRPAGHVLQAEDPAAHRQSLQGHRGVFQRRAAVHVDGPGRDCRQLHLDVEEALRDERLRQRRRAPLREAEAEGDGHGDGQVIHACHRPQDAQGRPQHRRPAAPAERDVEARRQVRTGVPQGGLRDIAKPSSINGLGSTARQRCSARPFRRPAC
jgi:hypothetical protein